MKVTVTTSTGTQELAKAKFLPSSPINFPHPMAMMAPPHIRGFILKEFDYGCRKLHRTVRRQRMTKKIKKWKRSVFRAKHNLPTGCGDGLLPPPKLPSALPTELSTNLTNKQSKTINTEIGVEEKETTTAVLPPSNEGSPPTTVSPASKPSRKRRAECLLISPIHSAKKSDRRPCKIDQMMLSARQLLDDDEDNKDDHASKLSSSCDHLVSPIAKKRRFF